MPAKRLLSDFRYKKRSILYVKLYRSSIFADAKQRPNP